MPGATPHPADIQGWLDAFGMPIEAVAALLGVTDWTLRTYAGEGRAPRPMLLALDRIASMEAPYLPCLAPSVQPRPELAEAVRLIRLAASCGDPADVYETATILQPVPGLLADARKSLRGAARKAADQALDLLQAEHRRGPDAWVEGDGLARCTSRA